jgi:hypothetical protein
VGEKDHEPFQLTFNGFLKWRCRSRGADRWRVTESSGEEAAQRRRGVREMARTWCRLPHFDSGLLVHDARDRKDEEFQAQNGGCRILPGFGVKLEMSA